ncbi:MAG TPA: ribonuclease III domain-containing protein, partial [Gammaproteobacteria bacterium]|nr:ribonuclease III domain-containing protein [Gammaproteobacteria bacterium]
MTSRGDWAEKHLRYTFKDPSLLERALTHRSASRDNNERLEYLGDSFLSFATARRLYDLRPHDDEGDLSRARAALVKQATLASVGQRLQLDEQVILGAGELRSGGAQRVAMLADSVEAVIGAVLLDGGTAAAEAVID